MGYIAPSVKIYSNDGSTLIWDSVFYVMDSGGFVSGRVTGTGLCNTTYDDYEYTYSGSLKFVGFADTPNASEPAYISGDLIHGSESGTNLYIVESLEGSTWYVPSGWKATAGYGKFAILGALNDDELVLGYYDGVSIGIGYDNDGEIYGGYANNIGYYAPSHSGGGRNVYSTSSIILSITGGADTTNASLIAWLSEYGELQPYTPEEPEIPEEPTTPKKKFTRLYLGDVVASIGGRAWKKLSAESEEVQDELQGIWVFNADIVTIPVSSNSSVIYNVDFITADGSYTADCIKLVNTGTPYYSSFPYELHYCGGNLGDRTVYNARYSDSNGMWHVAEHLQKIFITDTLAEVTNGSALLEWLKANATKQGTTRLISFTIDGTEYQALEGMTWNEWQASSYDTLNTIYSIVPKNSTTVVSPVDKIIANQEYVTNVTAGGGSN